MLRLNKNAEKVLKQFIEIGHPLQDDLREDYKQIGSAYNRVLRVFLYVNQDSLDVLSEENLDNIDSAVSRIYESLFWVRAAIASKDDPRFRDVEWLIISDRKNGLLTEVYRLTTTRLVKLPKNKFLYNAFLRLLNSYHLASAVTEISQSIAATQQSDFDRRQKVKRKRSGNFAFKIDPDDQKIDRVFSKGLDQRILGKKIVFESYFDS